MNRHNLMEQLFLQLFGQSANVICHAPGRVNLIGDHTDYNDGFVLPAAIDYGTDIAATARDDCFVHVYAHDYDQSAKFSLQDIQFSQDKMWLNYVSGTLQALLSVYPDLKGANIVVSGNVPQGAGLSSSASFEIAILKAFTELFKLDLNGVQAALLGQKAENNFVGCNCGIMDQLISAMGKTGHAMLLDCESLTFKDAPIPDNMALVIVNSNVKRGLVDSEYNIRRQQCEQVAQYFGKKSLRGVTLEQLEKAQLYLHPTLIKRARHVITENQRTENALVALSNNDIKQLSTLMRESHLSLKNDFDVTTPEVDGLVTIIANLLQQHGGVRMTGGGFGGCVIAITPTELVEQLIEHINKEYPTSFGLTADVYVCNASQGAFRVES